MKLISSLIALAISIVCLTACASSAKEAYSDMKDLTEELTIIDNKDSEIREVESSDATESGIITQSESSTDDTEMTYESATVCVESESIQKEEVPNELNVDEYINPIPSVDQFEQIAKDYMEQANDENIKSCHVSNYFGTYEGAVIVKFKKEYYNNDFGGFDDIIRIEVDDVVIEDCYGDNAYNVWKDGRFYSLHLAYDDGFGFLTKQDMIVLATIIGENKSIDLANS